MACPLRRVGHRMTHKLGRPWVSLISVCGSLGDSLLGDTPRGLSHVSDDAAGEERCGESSDQRPLDDGRSPRAL